MKKMTALVMSLVLLMMTAAAFAGDAPSFETLAGLEWSFSSGAGAWSTDMRIQAGGTFSGEYHDSEMGENSEEYPDGTVYGCSFTGRMSFVEQAGDYAWKIRIDELKRDEGQAEEAIDDGIRYVKDGPYGLSAGDEMLLYRPGTPVSELSEEMLMWAHVTDQENPPYELETWFLMSEKNSSGFVGYEIPDSVSIANPWVDLTEDQLKEKSGLSFGIPDGAENIIYRYLPGENLAEMQFTLGEEGDEFCARIQPAALRDGELMNIAGMYFSWENEEAITVGRCAGTIGTAQTGSEDWAELCLWYDPVQGLMYSLSVVTADPDGLDLAAVAEQVYIPAPGDA